MARDLDHLRRSAEQLVRRELGSRIARDAARHGLRRGARAIGRRLRNATLTVVVLLGLLVLSGIVTGGISLLTLLAAIVLIPLAALLVLFWPSSQRRNRSSPLVDGGVAVRLDRLAERTEVRLMERCRHLPGTAAPTLDRIVGRLRDLRPALARLTPDSPVGGDAERLIGKHLPGLVDTYLALPPSDRAFGSADSQRFTASLGLVADELDGLCASLGEDCRHGFDTELRFLETRYGKNSLLSLDRPA